MKTIEIVGAGLATQLDDLTVNLSTKPALPQGGSTFNINSNLSYNAGFGGLRRIVH